VKKVKKLRIGARDSKLSRIQVDIVARKIKQTLGIECEFVPIKTKGDIDKTKSLKEFKSPGVFVKEIELALLSREIDLAVHSLKDLPCEMDSNFEIVAVVEREDPKDVLVSKDGLGFYQLKPNAKIGTSSLRREVHLKNLREDIQVINIRGNIETRLSKIQSEGLDGIVLAYAALKRLKLDSYVSYIFDINEITPCPGQGAICIECLKDSPYKSILSKINDVDAYIQTQFERLVLKFLGGGCHSSIGVFCKTDQNKIYAFASLLRGDKLVKASIEGNKDDFLSLANKLSKMLES